MSNNETNKLEDLIERLIKVERSQLITRQWWYGLIYGTMFGIGGTVGVAVVLTLLGTLLKEASVIPIIGDWLSNLIPFVQGASR